MSNKIYTSFDQINRDLKVLRLEKEIKQEELKLRFASTKESVSFSPASTALSFLGAIVQKALVAKIIGKVFGYPRVEKQNLKE